MPNIDRQSPHPKKSTIIYRDSLDFFDCAVEFLNRAESKSTNWRALTQLDNIIH